LVENAFEELGITAAHVLRVVSFPLHHKDPFDRVLIAQAVTVGMPVVSADPVFDLYPVRRIW
jgi:PIN domain nuclease of toxin-antitoxin system